MTNKNKSENLRRRQRLDDVLAIYGANADRWPDAERDELGAFARSDRQAARMLAEAKALDRVMAVASPAEVPADLKERIVAAAVSDPEREAKVVPIDAARHRKHAPGGGALWPAAALAASLVFGIYLGLGDLGASAVSRALNLASAPDTAAVDLLSEGVSEDPEGIL